MTVLLIDRAGRKRCYEVSEGCQAEVRIPIPRPILGSLLVNGRLSSPALFEVATFRRTDELSWPPVYRQVWP